MSADKSSSSLPTTLPPPSQRVEALKHLVSQLRRTPASSPALLPLLSLTLRLVAATSTSSPSSPSSPSSTETPDPLPLRITLHLARTRPPPTPLPLDILISATLAYPTSTALGQVWTSALDADPELEERIRTEVIPGIIERLQIATTKNHNHHASTPTSSDSAHPPCLGALKNASRALLALSRANESLLALLLSESDYVIPALRAAYDSLSLGTGTGTGTGSGLEQEEEEFKAKGDTLAFCLGLLRAVQSDGVKSGLKKLMGVGSGVGVGAAGTAGGDAQGEVEAFVGTLGEDIVRLEKGQTEGVKGRLRAIREREARDDSRVQSILALFPSLPPRLLLVALHHPSFAPPRTARTPEDLAAPLLEAILGGGTSLPTSLAPLSRAIAHMHSNSSLPSTSTTNTTTNAPPSGPSGPSGTSTPTPAPANERRNIFSNDDLDLSRLRLKSSDPESLSFPLLPGVGAEIAPSMRENILRLVQRQAEEAEEQARAIAEARGERYVPERAWADGEEEEAYIDEDAPRGGKGGDGEESGEELEGDVLVQRRKKASAPVVHSYDPDIQSKLELAYLADPSVFDRDGMTRRSAARSKLKERTGMDDSQLEGWRIMLERNPHKDAILARHTFIPQLNVDYVVSRPASEVGSRSSRGTGGGGGGGGGGSGSGGGRGRGGGGAGGSRGGRGRGGSHSGSHTPAASENGGSSVGGGGGGGGSRGGRGGGGGGGGRGGQSKSSRGHANAQRTRGHDRKMAKMGA